MAVKSDKELMDEWFLVVDYEPTDDKDPEPDESDDDDERL